MKHALLSFIATLLICIFVPTFGQAQSDDRDDYGDGIKEDSDAFGLNGARVQSKRVPPRVKRERTDKVVLLIEEAANFCRQIPEEVYIIDCYASELKRAARSLPASGDYEEARAALEAASAKIEALVQSNLDTTRRPLSVRTSGARPKSGARKFNAVKPASLAKVKAQSAAIIREAQTVLLRSTGNTDRRRAHYQRISRSLETGTVMLRSL